MPGFGARIITTHLLLVAGVLGRIELSTPQRLALGTDAIYLLFLVAPRFGNSFIARIEHAGKQLARRKHAAILAVAIAAILIRVALLPVMPVPVPEVHDEFGYLLAGDTFAHGRLVNPPHSMSIYFDTFHVSQHPVYMSMYPPAQGAVLAIGQLLGNPWIGVLLSVAVMCGAIVWALQAWVPPGWALAGGVLSLMQIGVSSYWVNSFWGGAVAATAGALVIGALPRVIHRARPLHAVILGIGVAFLANSRPYEGAIFCLPVFATLVFWVWKRRCEWRGILRKTGVPIATVLFACGAFMLYYNARLTGNCLLTPEAKNVQTYYSTPVTIFEKARPPVHYTNPQFEAFYNGWWPSVAWHGSNRSRFEAGLISASADAGTLIDFFVRPALIPLTFVIPLAFGDRRMRLVLVQIGLGFAGFLTVGYFNAHYAAPFTVAFVLLLVQTMRHVRKWRFDGRQIGVGISRAVVLSAVIVAPVHDYSVNPLPSMRFRAAIARQLQRSPGKDLVIVRYSPDHDVLNEWVFNRAEIDDAKVVWVREIPGVSPLPLLDYFRGRKFWLVQPDQADPTLQPYSGSE